MDLLSSRISERLKAWDCMVRIVDIRHISELEGEILSLRENRLLDEELYKESLRAFNFDYKRELGAAGSVIVVAIPQQITRLNFSYGGKSHTAVIPPTYITGEIDRLVFENLKDILNEDGHKLIKPKKIPLKLLAVRSSLSKYGRNNITYVEGMGSLYKIQAFYTDYKCEEDSWQEAECMPSCSTCRLCADKCPTGCIDNERFLIHAENCLTNLNEYERDFPEWVDTNWHNSIIGCMECQLICPQNKKHIRITSIDNAFTEDEVELIIKNIPLKDLPENAAAVLRRFSLDEYYNDNVLSRNLKVLINK